MDSLEDTRKKIRARLVYEINHPECWYSDTDKARAKRNQDIYVNHPECPYSSGLGNVREYWYIWWLNNPDKPIMYGEVIHHINGNHQDNRIENLTKITRKEHTKIHGKDNLGRPKYHKPILASTNKHCDKEHKQTIYNHKQTDKIIMICPKDNQNMTRAGTGIRAGLGRCQKWQCSKCGHVIMENPVLAQPEPEKEVGLLTSACAEVAGTDHSLEPSGPEPCNP